MRFEALAKPVIRNPGRHVMQVVVADVAAEPVQDRRQIVVGTALDRRTLDAPVIAAGPVGVLELVLHVKEPDARCSRQEKYRQVHQQHRLPAECQREQGEDHRQHDVVDPDAGPFLPEGARQVERQTLLQEELDGRPEAKQHGHAAVEAIAHAPPPGCSLILADAHGDDVPDPATVQVAGRGMVNGMRASPVGIRHQRHDTEHAADGVVQALAGEERAMATVMLKDEQPNVEPCDRERQQQHDAVVPVQRIRTQPWHSSRR